MAIILLEGLDRTGKSTVAKEFKDQGYEVIHMSAPPKELSQPGYVGPSYLDMMVDLLQSCVTKDVVLDRTHYGELIWPNIYGRRPQLSEEDFEILREIEETAGVQRILMHDPNVEAHWQRCVENKEPLTRAQFLKARQLYDRMADKYGFEKKTLNDFTPTKNPSEGVLAKSDSTSSKWDTHSAGSTGDNKARVHSVGVSNGRTTEQVKLEQANAINEILSRRLIKSKGPVYDELETEVRHFLQDKLGKIFGENKTNELTPDEIIILKAFCRRLKEKETSK